MAKGQQNYDYATGLCIFHCVLWILTTHEALIEQSLAAAFAHLDIMSAHYGAEGPLLCLDSYATDGDSQPGTLKGDIDVLDCYTSEYKVVLNCAEAFMQKYPERPSPLPAAVILRGGKRLNFSDPGHTWKDYLTPTELSPHALKEELLEVCLQGQALDTAPLAISRTVERLSPKHLVARITKSQREMGLSNIGAPYGNVSDDFSCSPLNMLGNVKCTVGWSSFRAYNALVLQLKLLPHAPTVIPCSTIVSVASHGQEKDP
ncbi:uncharacterized protein ATNIH1004_008100 [Aspergillus tanneri]|uniref:Uncharacterized protein n=1 Tax=Aspergillus tanneri TaxID=1220188 RepID=A0A5M9MF33_9EURO|nr:uncharacterized protein ATNIH1004_008100 [Aspergillus tanneri]KAA8643904.1 hypothetical protein ATNIH1004_008100 [Aspergillus tanneri]